MSEDGNRHIRRIPDECRFCGRQIVMVEGLWLAINGRSRICTGQSAHGHEPATASGAHGKVDA